MKKILNWLKNAFLYLWESIPKVWICIFILSTIGCFLFSVEIGIIALFVLAAGYILFAWLRQLWWWITKTGDYETKNKKK